MEKLKQFADFSDWCQYALKYQFQQSKRSQSLALCFFRLHAGWSGFSIKDFVGFLDWALVVTWDDSSDDLI
jgi:hypothetical protein